MNTRRLANGVAGTLLAASVCDVVNNWVMPGTIGPRHPLRKLFSELVQNSLIRTAQVDDPALAVYISGLLTDFTHVEHLYRIRDARGKRLEDVGEMLIASNPLLEGRSFIYEREVRKHIGDYTLFMTGLFPEHVAKLPRKQTRVDAFIDYMKAGKESYGVVAAFNQFEFRDEAPLFGKLAEKFELCVFTLNQVKSELERMQQPQFRAVRDILAGSGGQ